MKSTFKVLFYARNNRVNKNGEVGIMGFRPEFSLHFLLLNPISNLHFIFNPKYSLLFLNFSLWSGAQ